MRLLFSAVFQHRTRGNPHHRFVGRHRVHHDGVGTDAGVVSHRKAAENLSPGPDHDVFADRGVTFRAAAETGAAQRNAVVNRAVVAHFGRFSDHDAHAVVNEDAAADLGRGVNFNTGQETRRMAHHTGRYVPPLKVAPVGPAVHHQGVKPRIRKRDLELTLSGRVFFKNGFDIFLNAFKHARNPYAGNPPANFLILTIAGQFF